MLLAADWSSDELWGCMAEVLSDYLRKLPDDLSRNSNRSVRLGLLPQFQ